MKRAKVKIISVDAECPYCGGEVPDPDSGSLYININQYSSDTVFTCQDCGKEFQLELKAFK